MNMEKQNWYCRYLPNSSFAKNYKKRMAEKKKKRDDYMAKRVEIRKLLVSWPDKDKVRTQLLQEFDALWLEEGDDAKLAEFSPKLGHLLIKAIEHDNSLKADSYYNTPIGQIDKQIAQARATIGEYRSGPDDKFARVEQKVRENLDGNASPPVIIKARNRFERDIGACLSELHQIGEGAKPGLTKDATKEQKALLTAMPAEIDRIKKKARDICRAAGEEAMEHLKPEKLDELGKIAMSGEEFTTAAQEVQAALEQLEATNSPELPSLRKTFFKILTRASKAGADLRALTQELNALKFLIQSEEKDCRKTFDNKAKASKAELESLDAELRDLYLADALGSVAQVQGQAAQAMSLIEQSRSILDNTLCVEAIEAVNEQIAEAREYVEELKNIESFNPVIDGLIKEISRMVKIDLGPETFFPTEYQDYLSELEHFEEDWPSMLPSKAQAKAEEFRDRVSVTVKADADETDFRGKFKNALIADRQLLEKVAKLMDDALAARKREIKAAETDPLVRAKLKKSDDPLANASVADLVAPLNEELIACQTWANGRNNNGLKEMYRDKHQRVRGKINDLRIDLDHQGLQEDSKAERKQLDKDLKEGSKRLSKDISEHEKEIKKLEKARKSASGKEEARIDAMLSRLNAQLDERKSDLDQLKTDHKQDEERLKRILKRAEKKEGATFEDLAKGLIETASVDRAAEQARQDYLGQLASFKVLFKAALKAHPNTKGYPDEVKLIKLQLKNAEDYGKTGGDIASGKSLLDKCRVDLDRLKTLPPNIDRSNLGAIHTLWSGAVVNFGKAADKLEAKVTGGAQSTDDRVKSFQDQLAEIRKRLNPEEFYQAARILRNPEIVGAARLRTREEVLARICHYSEFLNGDSFLRHCNRNPFKEPPITAPLSRALKKIELEILRGI